jgi:hypothetical protein
MPRQGRKQRRKRRATESYYAQDRRQHEQETVRRQKEKCDALGKWCHRSFQSERVPEGGKLGWNGEVS